MNLQYFSRFYNKIGLIISIICGFITESCKSTRYDIRGTECPDPRKLHLKSYFVNRTSYLLSPHHLANGIVVGVGSPHKTFGAVEIEQGLFSFRILCELQQCHADLVGYYGIEVF